MTEMITMERDELTRLQERTSKLAREKSYLQVLIRLMSRISEAPGLENTIQNLLRSIPDVIGGINIILYYMIDETIMYCDVFGREERLTRIEDDLVRQVYETRQPLEFEHDFQDTRMLTKEFTKAYTWVYPLQVGQEIVGVLKLESLHIGMRELYEKLPLFFNYVALILKNEIQGQSQRQQTFEQLRESNARLTREIDERQLAEESRRRQEKFTSTLLESLPDGVVACDANGILSLFNRAAREWHGLDPMALPPEQWAERYDLYEPDGRTPLTAETVPLARAFRGEVVRDAEMTILARNQAPRHILANATPFFDEAANKLGAVAIMMDITARKASEAALLQAKKELESTVLERTHELRESNEQLQTELIDRRQAEAALQQKTAELDRFFSVALDLLCIADTDARFIRLNMAWEAALGYTIDELMAERFLDLVHPDDLSPTLQAIATLSSQREVTDFVNRYRCRDGSYRFLEWRAAPAGRMIYAAARDITERIRTEEELHRLNVELEQRVQDRTAELKEKNAELERMNKLFIGRELRMIELKEKIRRLEGGK